MKVKLVSVESSGKGYECHTLLWSGQLTRTHIGFYGDFEIDLPRDLRLGTLTKDKQLRIEVILE